MTLEPELRQTTDLALCATKQAAPSIGRSLGALVATERHLIDTSLTEVRFLQVPPLILWLVQAGGRVRERESVAAR